MEYLHHSSVSATKSELELFRIPPTQTAIDSSYEVEYRPISSLDSTRTYDFLIPPADDFTDLSSLRIYAQVKIIPNFKAQPNEDVQKKFWDSLSVCQNFGNALAEQIDVKFNNTNISVSNNLHPNQSFIEDLFYRHKTPVEIGNLIGEPALITEKIKNKVFDLYFRLHTSIAQQNNLLLNGVPIGIKLIRTQDSYPLINPSENVKATIMIEKISIFLRRVRLFPDVQAAIAMALEKSAAKYFITRNEIKSFSIGSGISSVSIENVFTGTLPRRLIVGFVKNSALTGDEKTDPFQFNNFDINHIAAIVDGVQYPAVPYTPDFEKDLYIREYVGMYEALNQDEGIPQIEIEYKDYKSRLCFFCFDLSSDGYLGGESGVLSLMKRGYIRVDI